MNNTVILDIGKTHTKVILYDVTANTELSVFQHTNQIRTAQPYPHLDVETIKEFVFDALKQIAHTDPVDGIFVSAHGAALVLMRGDERVLPVLDYEYDGPDSLAEEYDHIRPGFAHTGAPRMARGLHLGAQLFWLQRTFPQEFATADKVLFWSQFWSYLLCGVAASEIAYASCHTDLWDIEADTFLPLSALGIDSDLAFPPLRPASDVMGTIRPEIAAATGLASDVKIYCGGHDSSLSLVRTTLEHAMPCTVLSTGTWVTLFALGNDNRQISPQPGLMMSIDCFGNPVLNFRFQGGKIYADRINEACDDETAECIPYDIEVLEMIHCDQAQLSQIVDRNSGEAIDLSHWPRRQVEQVTAHLLALHTLKGLAAIEARGEIICSGPFADNDTYIKVLRRGWPWPVILQENRLGLCGGIAALISR